MKKAIIDFGRDGVKIDYLGSAGISSKVCPRYILRRTNIALVHYSDDFNYVPLPQKFLYYAERIVLFNEKVEKYELMKDRYVEINDSNRYLSEEQEQELMIQIMKSTDWDEL